jgi:hypothetical protein
MKIKRAVHPQSFEPSFEIEYENGDVEYLPLRLHCLIEHEKEIVDILTAIAEGYPVKGVQDQYIVVENPDYLPDNGKDPRLVFDIYKLYPDES